MGSGAGICIAVMKSQCYLGIASVAGKYFHTHPSQTKFSKIVKTFWPIWSKPGVFLQNFICKSMVKSQGISTKVNKNNALLPSEDFYPKMAHYNWSVHIFVSTVETIWDVYVKPKWLGFPLQIMTFGRACWEDLLINTLWSYLTLNVFMQ